MCGNEPDSVHKLKSMAQNDEEQKGQVENAEVQKQKWEYNPPIL